MASSVAADLYQTPVTVNEAWIAGQLGAKMLALIRNAPGGAGMTYVVLEYSSYLPARRSATAPVSCSPGQETDDDRDAGIAVRDADTRAHA
jgi:hypothetical protein